MSTTPQRRTRAALVLLAIRKRNDDTRSRTGTSGVCTRNADHGSDVGSSPGRRRALRVCGLGLTGPLMSATLGALTERPVAIANVAPQPPEEVRSIDCAPASALKP